MRHYSILAIRKVGTNEAETLPKVTLLEFEHRCQKLKVEVEVAFLFSSFKSNCYDIEINLASKIILMLTFR